MDGNKASDCHDKKGPDYGQLRSFLISLCRGPPTYDHNAPKIEYWIEYLLRERFATVDELVEGISSVSWQQNGQGSYANIRHIGRFLKEFRDAPRRSEQGRSFVTQFCSHLLRRFAVASIEDNSMYRLDNSTRYLYGKGWSFVNAASFIGHLINWGLLNHELVQRHLIKPLLTTCSIDFVPGDIYKPARANAIYRLFIAAGNSLMGFLEPEDVQACFEILDAKAQGIVGFNAARLKELRETHAAWVRQKEEEEQRNSGKIEGQGGEEDAIAAKVSAAVKSPDGFVPRDIPAGATSTTGIEISSSTWQDIGSSSILDYHAESSSEDFVDATASVVTSSPTLSSISDLTLTDPGGVEHGQERAASRHDTFYFGDGNVEIVCEGTIFRVHATVVSLSSSKLQGILSRATLLRAPTPGGCPRITISERAADFATLLRMIYSPGFPPRHEVPDFSVFASLLRMTTKYGFSNVREQLVEDLKSAYPTKWEDFRNAKVLGEDVFRSPRPHPNAVLNLLEEQEIRFAIPFAAYRASAGGFSVLMSDEPGAVLSRHTLATTIHGMHALRSVASQAARVVAYGGDLGVCPNEGCALNAGTDPTKPRIEALEKIYNAMMRQREGGVLRSPSFGDLLCATCLRSAEAAHVVLGSICWEKLPSAFHVSNGWDDL